MDINQRIAAIKQQIGAVDPAPWRAVFEDGDLVIWFHARLKEDPRRVIVAYGEIGYAPSRNERAAARFMVDSREHCQALIEEVERLRAELAQANESPDRS